MLRDTTRIRQIAALIHNLYALSGIDNCVFLQ